MSKEHTVQKIVNVLVYAFLITASAVSFSGNNSMTDLFEIFETYFDPAPWVFYLWTLIYLLLGGFVIYQWFDQAHEAALHGVGWHFALSGILNTLWLSLMEGEHKVLAFLVAILQVFSISFIFYKLEAEYPANNWWSRLFLHAPFSLWHGWSVFISVVTAFVAFTHVNKDSEGVILPPNVFHIILFYIAVGFLAFTAIGYVEFKGQKGDITSAWVIAFGLWSVFAQQTYDTTRWGALAGAIITTLWPAKPFIMKAAGRDSGENAPLLG
ncbi:hypothetical protein DM01DRAFT_1404283 [Hesseltinella vesiculosa]|uniref:Tryptophan-rich sensory protein n=1 Tax=Hesseltinella vesiculosa TaxID=101127 RepID=A0A1X2GU33_9FUNG|nr:hypothetical protein DM01DRAFT_1404283 [Hesseltinella vesiculosa]